MLVVAIGSAALLAWLISWVLASIRRNSNSGLQDVPNAHFSVPYSRLWLLSLRWRRKENRTRSMLHRRLGPVIRIGPRDVSVNCIDDGVRTIYSSKFDKDGAFYHELFDQTGFMVAIIGNEEHKKRKKMLSHPYSNSSILNSQALSMMLSRVSSRLQEGMAKWASSGASVDVFQKAKCCTLDVGSGWIFGSENATDTLRYPSFEADLSRLGTAALERLILRTSFERPLKYFAHLIDKLPDAKMTGRWQEWVTRAVTNCYKKHSSKDSTTASLFDHFYHRFKAANPDMSRNDMASVVAVECDDQLSASHLGLGTLLAYTMYELSRDTDSQAALRNELLDVGMSGEQSLPHRLASLPILDAVITETMRTRAPCPGPFPRIVPESGCRLAGKYDLPGGTVVSSSAWALHFNPIPFPCPDEWRPSRWLEADEATAAEMHKWIWTFGSGARVCIGTHYSMRVLKELLYTIYTDYETCVDEEFTEGVDQEDAFSAGPLADCLKLKFRQVSTPIRRL